METFIDKKPERLTSSGVSVECAGIEVQIEEKRLKIYEKLDYLGIVAQTFINDIFKNFDQFENRKELYNYLADKHNNIIINLESELSTIFNYLNSLNNKKQKELTTKIIDNILKDSEKVYKKLSNLSIDNIIEEIMFLLYKNPQKFLYKLGKKALVDNKFFQNIKNKLNLIFLPGCVGLSVPYKYFQKFRIKKDLEIGGYYEIPQNSLSFLDGRFFVVIDDEENDFLEVVQFIKHEYWHFLSNNYIIPMHLASDIVHVYKNKFNELIHQDKYDINKLDRVLDKLINIQKKRDILIGLDFAEKIVIDEISAYALGQNLFPMEINDFLPVDTIEDLRDFFKGHPFKEDINIFIKLLKQIFELFNYAEKHHEMPEDMLYIFLTSLTLEEVRDRLILHLNPKDYEYNTSQ